jgi:hypothetical protein
MIKYTSEQQERVDFLNYLKDAIDEINTSGNVRIGDKGLMQLKDDLLELTKDNQFTKVELTNSKFDLFDKIKQYSDLFLHIISDEIFTIDPMYGHNLMKKRVSEMTGYEYQKYLKLIGS